MASDSSVAPLLPGALCWVQMPDFPWWPAKVLDPVEAGQATDDLQPGHIFVYFFGSGEGALIDGTDASSCVPFASRNAAEDEARAVSEGNTVLADAIQQASNDGREVAAEPANEGDADEEEHSSASGDHVVGGGEDPAGGEGGKDEERRRRKAEKKEMRRLKKLAKQARHDERSPRKKQQKSATEKSSSKKRGADQPRPKAKGESRRGREQNRRSADDEDADGAAHTRHAGDDAGLGEVPRVATKRDATDDELVRFAAEIGDAIAAADVAAVRRLLSTLTRIAVDFWQLYNTKVGVAVSRVLDAGPVFYSAKPLASAILTFWYKSLPLDKKQLLRSVPDRTAAISERLLAGQTLENALHATS